MPLPTVKLNPNMTYPQLIAALNENFAMLENINKTLIIKDNTGTPRIVIGFIKGGF